MGGGGRDLNLALASLHCRGQGHPPDEAEAPAAQTVSSPALGRPVDLLAFSTALQRAGPVRGSPGTVWLAASIAPSLVTQSLVLLLPYEGHSGLQLTLIEGIQAPHSFSQPPPAASLHDPVCETVSSQGLLGVL